MKMTVTLLILFILLLPHTYAQDSPQWHLPDGAKMRLGKGTIHEIKYSPDGNTLASGSEDGTILLWEVIPAATTPIGNVNQVRVVNTPDPNLRAKIETALGKSSGAVITMADMATLTRLDAPNANTIAQQILAG